MRKIRLWIEIAIVFYLSLLPLRAEAIMPTVTFEPVSQEAVLGDSFYLDVVVKDVEDLYGFQFQLSFDPEIVEAISLVEGDFLSTGGSTFFKAGEIDNTAGTIDWTYGLLLDGVPGVSGSGSLTTLNFNAIGSGTTLLTLSNVKLVDSSSQEITCGVEDGSITVIPEPANILLFSLGLIGLFVLGSKRIQKEQPYRHRIGSK